VKIEEVIRTVNQMKVSTLDVDIFIDVHAMAGSSIISLDPILSYLRERGCKMEGEHIVISGWPVQFLPAGGPLLEEALASAGGVDVEGVSTRVLPPEYLAAIALQTGRAKDKARLLQFIEAKAIDLARFEKIVRQHGLSPKWQKFQQQFLGS